MSRSMAACALAASLVSSGCATSARVAQPAASGDRPQLERTERVPDDEAPKSAPGARPAPGVGETVVGAAVALALVEGALVGYSSLAAHWPRETGWTMVGLSPIVFLGSMGFHGDDPWPGVVGCAGIAGLGLYEALELSGGRYSRADRFRRSLVGLNAIGVAIGVTVGLTGNEKPKASTPRVAFGVDAGSEAPKLLVGGRF